MLTQEEFKRLTLLITAKQFAMWSGLRPRTIRDLAQSGVIHRLPLGGGKHRYYKTDLAKLRKFEL